MTGEVTYRLAREDDLSTMRLIQSHALYDLVVTRSGRKPSAVPIIDEPSAEMRHLLRTDPKLSWIASEGGRQVGFSVGFVRADLWFLSDLFVLPEAYGKGIGGELLRRCIAGGQARGVRIRAVASSHDAGAQKLYIEAGMVPRFPLFSLAGEARKLRELPAAPVEVSAIGSSKSWVRRLAELDKKVWGRERDRDHRYWLGEAGLDGIAILERGELAAYAYFAAEGHSRRVGPMACSRSGQQLRLLRAIGDAIGTTQNVAVELRVPGINMIALTALLKIGMKIDHAGFYMASHPFGRFDRYLPSGGTLL